MQQDIKSEHTKQLIIDEAFKLFYKNGFKATSIPQIMKAASLTKGAFYHHYKNKEELGLKVIDAKIQKRVVETMIEPLQQDGDALSLIEATFKNRIKSFPEFDKQHGCPLNNFINEIGDYEVNYQTAMRKVIDKWKEALVATIERGIKDKTIDPSISSASVAIYLISAFEGVRGIRKLYNDDQILKEYLNGLAIYLDKLKV